VSEGDTREPEKRLRAPATLREHLALRGAIGDRVISIAQILGRPVRDAKGTRIGKVNDIVVRWNTANDHPPVTGVLITVGGKVVFVRHPDAVLSQTEVRLRSDEQMVSRRSRRYDFAVARDVLDHQLVDTSGVQVVRASDAYLVDAPQGWALAGIDVGVWSFARRLFPRPKVCPRPDRVIDWAGVQAFVPRFTDVTSPWESGRTQAAGIAGSGVQLAGSAADLKELRGADVAALLADLNVHQQAHLVASVQPPSAAEALNQLDTDHREALLAVLDESDRARLRAMLDGDAR
jgi:magnesium transporter